MVTPSTEPPLVEGVEGLQTVLQRVGSGVRDHVVGIVEILVDLVGVRHAVAVRVVDEGIPGRARLDAHELAVAGGHGEPGKRRRGKRRNRLTGARRDPRLVSGPLVVVAFLVVPLEASEEPTLLVSKLPPDERAARRVLVEGHDAL